MRFPRPALLVLLCSCGPDLDCEAAGLTEHAGQCVPPPDAGPDVSDSGSSTTGGDSGTTADAGDGGRDAEAGCDDPVTYYRDQDDDGLGDPAMERELCEPEDGWVTNDRASDE